MPIVPHCGAAGGQDEILDVNVFRSAGGGISEHNLVVAKIKCLRRWTGRVVRMEERFEIKVSELSKVTGKTAYEKKKKMKQRWESVRE